MLSTMLERLLNPESSPRPTNGCVVTVPYTEVTTALTTFPQFNLETPDSDLFPKEVREKYKSISVSPPPPPLEIQVLLCIPELTNNQVLVHLAPDSSRRRVEPTPKYILLEAWVLAFSPRQPGEEDTTDVALSTIYKHGIPLFRSLFSLLRLLPVWTLYKRLRRRTGGVHRNANLSIKLRVRTGMEDDSEDFLLGFGEHTH